MARRRSHGGTSGGLVGVALTTVLTLLGCDDSVSRPAGSARVTPAGVGFGQSELAAIARLSPLPSPPPDPTNRFADDPAAIELGRLLFFDPRLSAEGDIACATCHEPERGWTDGRDVAHGRGVKSRNTAALFNVAYQRWMFWDGRADSLWAQWLVPLEDPDEMGSSRTAVARLVATDPVLRAAYQATFGEAPSLPANLPLQARPAAGRTTDPEHPHVVAWLGLDDDARGQIDRVAAQLGKALAAFQRTIVSRDSPFDRFARGLLDGDPAAMASLDGPAQRGLKRFLAAGCTNCHDGPNFSDGEFHNLGLGRRSEAPLDGGRFLGISRVKADPFNGLGRFSDAPQAAINDRVRYVAARPHNLGEFKTPGLREVARTAPYFHDGRFATLGEVLRFYSELDPVPALGHREETLVALGLPEIAIDELAAFLGALTGAPPPLARLHRPGSVASGDPRPPSR